MRLWHTALIPVLPRQQLLGQWRECWAIYEDWKKKKQGVPKKGAYACDHPLVSYAFSYDDFRSRFHAYCKLVRDEMLKRGYKVTKKELPFDYLSSDYSYPYALEHDSEYFEICYYNLLEKYRRGLIGQDEFAKIQQLYNEMKEEKK